MWWGAQSCHATSRPLLATKQYLHLADNQVRSTSLLPYPVKQSHEGQFDQQTRLQILT
jgi:hypothetical protein